MKKIFTLHILGASSGVYHYTVEATNFHYNNGFYAFYNDKILVGTYPINRTIIYKIDEKTELQ